MKAEDRGSEVDDAGGAAAVAAQDLPGLEGSFGTFAEAANLDAGTVDLVEALGQAAARRCFLPLNVLAQPYDDHALAEHIAEAFRWAWPELAHGAPTFENVLKHSMIALRQAGKPLTRLADLLT